MVNENADWKKGIFKVFKGNLVLMFCHLLLHLIDLSDLAYSPHIAQLLVWLPAPRRVHEGHIFFVHSAFQTHALQREHLCVSEHWLPSTGSTDVMLRRHA